MGWEIAVPAIVTLIGTGVSAGMAASNRPKKQDIPTPKPDLPDVDQELMDAQRRKGRRALAAASPDEGLLVGGSVGAQQTLGGSAPTLIGN